MLLNVSFELPFQDPVLVFSLILLIILLVPLSFVILYPEQKVVE